ncbi:TetR family transcriptional regulator, partial [Nonomuraea sp. RK-328]|nr:TetR family transcriptional regulator [Nonomuraea sp. RK-328]
MNAEVGQRRYDSLRRTAQALETRAEIARAARRLFVERGGAATTVRDVAREAASDDPPRQLAAMSGFDRRLYERAGDVILLLREAGRSEPELATVYRDGRARADGFRATVFSSWPAGILRPGLDVPAALDVHAGLCGIDVCTTLTVERGWSPDRVERWWSEALVRELLS